VEQSVCREGGGGEVVLSHHTMRTNEVKVRAKYKVTDPCFPSKIPEMIVLEAQKKGFLEVPIGIPRSEKFAPGGGKKRGSQFPWEAIAVQGERKKKTRGDEGKRGLQFFF